MLNRPFISALLLTLPLASTADQTIIDDLIVHDSLCVGEGCATDMDFGYDSIVVNSPTPQILFQDTSTSASFPTDDWLVGITDGGAALPSSFFIKNLTHDLDALVISADGDVALGSGSEVVVDAVSVGDLGNERRVTNVAEGVDDNDAVIMAQFNAFKTDATASISSDVDAIDDRLTQLESRLSSLVDRLEAVAAKVD